MKTASKNYRKNPTNKTALKLKTAQYQLAVIYLKEQTEYMLYFDLRPGPKMLFLGNTPKGSDTFQRPVIGRDRVGGLRLMRWDKVKVLL